MLFLSSTFFEWKYLDSKSFSSLDILKLYLVIKIIFNIAIDTVIINSYINQPLLTDVKDKIYNSILQLIDRFSPQNCIIFCSPILNTDQLVKNYIQDKYKEYFYKETYDILQSEDINSLDFTPQSQFMRSIIVYLIEKLQYIISQKQCQRIEFIEDYNLITDLLLQNQANCFIYGIDTSLRLKFIYKNIQAKIIMPQTSIYEKQSQNVIDSQRNIFEYGIIIQDFKKLRELIICDLLQDYLNSDDKTSYLYEQMYQNYPQIDSCSSRQKVREEILQHPCIKSLLADFITLVLFTGTSYLPEMPGQTYKNGLLDQLIENYQQNNLKSFPFLNITNQDNQVINYFTLQGIFKIISRNEMMWVVNDIKDLTKLTFSNIDEQFRVQQKQDLLDISLTQDQIHKITTMPVGKLLADHQLAKQVVKSYKVQYYNKICECDQLNGQIVSQLQLQDYTIISLFDHAQNIKESQKVPDNILQILEKHDNIKQYELTLNMIREYFKSFQSILLSIFYTNSQHHRYPYKYSPFASLVLQYCETFTQQIKDSVIQNILWEYSGPKFVYQHEISQKLYKTIPKSMLYKFILTSQTEQWKNISLENFELKHQISPFLVRSMKLNGKFPNIQSVLSNVYLFEDLGFQNFSFSEKCFICISDSESQFLKEDNVELDQIFQPLHYVITQSIKRTQEFKNFKLISQCQKISPQSFLPRNTFYLLKGVFLYTKQSHLLISGKQTDLPQVITQFISNNLQSNTNLCILTESAVNISRLSSKFNIISKQYLSNTLQITYEQTQVTNGLDYTDFTTSEKFDGLNLPDDVKSSILGYFDQQVNQIFDNQLFAADVNGLLRGIIYDNSVLDMQKNDIMQNVNVEKLIQLSSLYFKSNKCLVSNDSIYFILSQSDLELQQLLQHAPVIQQEPFISSLSVFDNSEYVIVPLSLINRLDTFNNVSKNYDIITGKSISIKDKTHLKLYLQNYVRQVLSDQNEVLTFELNKEDIELLALNILDKFSQIIPVSYIHSEVEKVAQITTQTEYQAISSKKLDVFNSQLSNTVSIEYLNAQLNTNLSNQDIQKLLTNHQIACPDNSLREFGLCAYTDGLIDLSLVNMELQPTYKAAIILITFQKAFPTIFKMLTSLISKDKIEFKDLLLLQQDKFKFSIQKSDIVLNQVFPFYDKMITSTTDMLDILTLSSIFLHQDLIKSHSFISREGKFLEASYINVVKTINVVRKEADFIINLYTLSQNTQNIELLDTVFVQNKGVGVVVGINGKNNVVLINKDLRFIQKDIQIWRIGKSKVKAQKQIPFKDFINCNKFNQKLDTQNWLSE